MKNKYYLVGGLIAIMVSVIGVTSLVSANFRKGGEFNPENCPEKHQAMSFESFDVWAEKMNEMAGNLEKQAQEIRASITEEHFENLSQVHQLMEEGNFEEAKRLREELGLEAGPMMRFGR